MHIGPSWQEKHGTSAQHLVALPTGNEEEEQGKIQAVGDGANQKIGLKVMNNKIKNSSTATFSFLC